MPRAVLPEYPKVSWTADVNVKLSYKVQLLQKIRVNKEISESPTGRVMLNNSSFTFLYRAQHSPSKFTYHYPYFLQELNFVWQLDVDVSSSGYFRVLGKHSSGHLFRKLTNSLFYPRVNSNSRLLYMSFPPSLSRSEISFDFFSSLSRSQSHFSALGQVTPDYI